MTPLSNVDWEDRIAYGAALLELCERCPMPSGKVIESWFGLDSDGPGRPLNALLILYRAGGLSREHRRRVKERLGTEPEFRARRVERQLGASLSHA